MSLALRILLFISAIALFAVLMTSIKKSKMKIEDALFWIVLTAGIVVLGVFPQIASSLSELFGFMSPSNFVFLLFIFILLVKGYYTSKQVSELDTKMRELSQQLAIERLEHHERSLKNDHRSDELE